MFDKWAVYLAFTVNEAGCDDVLPPPLVSASLAMRSGFLARALNAFRRRNWPFIAKGWDISPGPNGFHSWVSPRLPLSSSFIQHQKDTPSTWPRSRPPSQPPHPPKEIRDSLLLIKLLAITLPPLLDGFPSMFFKFCVRSDGLTGFPGNLRKSWWI